VYRSKIRIARDHDGNLTVSTGRPMPFPDAV